MGHDIIYLTRESTELTDQEWDSLAELTRQAFQERTDEGLRMLPCHIYGIGLKKYGGRSKRCMVIAKDKDKIVGYIMCKVYVDSEGIRCAEELIAATHPKSKGQGIGRQLYKLCEDYAIQQGCIYITDNTSTKAKSAIAYHLSCGLKKWEYTHFNHTNYYSVYFRKYFNNKNAPKYRLFHRLHSWLKIRMQYRESGQMGVVQRLKLHLNAKRHTPIPQGELLSIQQVRAISTNLLHEFVQFCNTYNLKYMLCNESLLGVNQQTLFHADIDTISVCMPLPDYEKFVDIYEANNPIFNLTILYGTKLGVAVPYTLLVDNRTKEISEQRDNEHSCPHSLKIYPTFAIANDEKLAQQQLQQLNNAVKVVLSCQSVIRKNPFSYLYRLFFNGQILEHALKKVHQLLHQCTWGGTNKIALSYDGSFNQIWNRDVFENCSSVTISNNTYNIPGSFEETIIHFNQQNSYKKSKVWLLNKGKAQTTQTSSQAVRFKLFSFLPILTIKKKAKRTRFYLLSFIPFIDIKHKQSKHTLLFLCFIPLLSWKHKN